MMPIEPLITEMRLMEKAMLVEKTYDKININPSYSTAKPRNTKLYRAFFFICVLRNWFSAGLCWVQSCDNHSAKTIRQ